MGAVSQLAGAMASLVSDPGQVPRAITAEYNRVGALEGNAKLEAISRLGTSLTLEVGTAAIGGTGAASKLGWFARGTAKGTPGVLQVGGAYRDVKGTAGYEAHHAPANSVTSLSKGEGPSIAMHVDDHRLTASWGNSSEARAFRQAQAELIAKGDFRGAQELEVNDITGKFGNRYDDAIQQMLKYSQDKGHW